MIIQIEIKLEDNNGKILHQFKNCLDEKDAQVEKPVNSSCVGKDFEAFLAEYLSFSGFVLREKLIGDNYADTQDNTELTAYSGMTDEIITDESLNDSELEYRIRLGDNKVLIGKVPLKLEPFMNKAVPAKQKEKSKEEQQSSCPAAIINAPPIHEKAVIETIINYAMVKAIEKYEENLYPASYDTDYSEVEPSLSN